MNAFPAFVPLVGARVVVAGAGDAAEAKVRLLASSPAELVRVTDPEAASSPEAYAGALLAFIALPETLAKAAADAARAAGAWVNVVDRPELSDFYTPAIVDRGAVVGAIGTGGSAPLLASQLRVELEARWPRGLGNVAELLADLRDELRERFPDPRMRRRSLRALLDGDAARLALAGEPSAARDAARRALESHEPASGRIVALSPPADAELLTLRALQWLARADRIVAAETIDPLVLQYARRDALRATGATGAELVGWRTAGEVVVVISPKSAWSSDHPPADIFV